MLAVLGLGDGGAEILDSRRSALPGLLVVVIPIAPAVSALIRPRRVRLVVFHRILLVSVFGCSARCSLMKYNRLLKQCQYLPNSLFWIDKKRGPSGVFHPVVLASDFLF